MKNQFKDTVIDDGFIKELYFGNKQYPNINYMRKDWLDAHPNVKDYLERRYADSESIKETVYRIFLDIEERPVCPVCGGKVQFLPSHRFSRKERNGNPFLVCCSPKCNANYEKTKLHKKQGSIRHYGTDNPAKAKEVQDKMKETNRKKYGVDNPYQSEEIKNKIRETNIQKYGVDNAMKLSETIAKAQATCKKKYGETSYTKTQECQEKIVATKRKNRSFNTSTKEVKLFEMLKHEFGEVCYQYRSTEYPFNCDFYIPEYKLYIEYNGIWTHYYHPFDRENPADIIELNWQKQKGKYSKFYQLAVWTWSESDVLKLNTAKQNMLNYLVIYQFIPFDKVIKFIREQYTANTFNKQWVIGIK